MLNVAAETRMLSLPSPETKLFLSVHQPAAKPKRRVRFHEARIVTFLTPASCLSHEERNNVWYPQSDLDEFRTEVRFLCRQLRDSPKQTETRGLEHRVCLDRQQNKHLAIRCVLKAQNRCPCPEFIARISNKCTAWAKEVALAEATRDFCEAYHPHLASHVPKVGPSGTFPMALKKRGSDSREPERQVRARTETSGL